jgi:hypothetical protein
MFLQAPIAAERCRNVRLARHSQWAYAYFQRELEVRRPLSGATHEPFSRQWSYGAQRCSHAASPPMEV